MTNLKPTDFSKEEIGTLVYLRHEYIGWDGNIYEVCLEPCLNGFDVANYLVTGYKHPELTDEKYCVDMEMRPGNGLDLLEALTRALAMATIFKQRYAYKMAKTIIKDDLPDKGPQPVKSGA